MLEYIALGMLIFVVITLFYGVIVIHDIPYEIAKKRNHPQQDALHVAGWISLFTLHVLWPFLWIWATLYRDDRGWGFSENKNSDDTENSMQLIKLQNRVELLEAALLAKNESAPIVDDSLQQTVDIDNEASQLFADLDNMNKTTQGDK